MKQSKPPGRIQKAPENFLDQQLIQDITASGIDSRRRLFMRASLLAAASTGLAGKAAAQATADGDPAILQLPAHSTSLGLPVASNPYGQPSKYE
jgi:sulfane dehydrogenase subunit SoxC